MAIRVLLMTQWFDPEPTFKGLVFARALVEKGFDVEVITGFPNYPGGKVYPGYKVKLLQKEQIDGVSLVRVPLYPSHDKSRFGRILNYVSFSISLVLYGLFSKKPDIIYSYHPPLTVGVASAVIGFFRRVPVVNDIQDMWPDTLRSTGMISNRRVLSMVGKICDWVYRRAAKIVVLSPGFKKLLVERGVPAEKISVIYNWCAEDAIGDDQGVNQSVMRSCNKFRILFAGNMGRAQALDVVLSAAKILEVKAPEIEFVFLGGGLEVENLKKLAKRLELDNVDFLPPVPMSEVGNYLRSADALLVHLKKDDLFKITIPSKTQAYMAAGRPLLMAVDGDAAELVAKSGSGVVANSGDANSISEAAIELFSATDDERRIMSENGLSYYNENLSLQCGVEKFALVFKSLAV
ncbi:glycosyltransferase family 4 protein [Pseudomonas marginalis]|uniref:glycosyltransferase family 4 protein n=1 Tax=Pseudomonas marginalis TaxID=298 RepID=UPI002033FC96|nr:glycosyltransferase family 4 protein [Pseudomonas marginalis]MCM2379520.1 glycosyltransferase family 4 protein [Pseudomonas marginalis]